MASRLMMGLGLGAAVLAAVANTGFAAGEGALKVLSGQTRELAANIDSTMEVIEKAVKEAETATNSIKDKGDTQAIAEANRKLDNLKAGTAKLEDQVGELRKLAMKMEREIAKAKK